MLKDTMKKITDQYVDDIYQDLWSELKAQYKTAYKVPNELAQEAGELARGLHVIQIWQSKGAIGNPLSILAHYSVSQQVAERIVKEHLGQIIQKSKKIEQVAADSGKSSIGTKAKLEKLVSHATQNYGQTFTTEQLSEISGFSPQTTIKHLKIIRHYRRVKRGVYEAQNPKTI